MIAWGGGTAFAGTDEIAGGTSFHLDDASLPQTSGEADKSVKADALCKAEASQAASPSDQSCKDAFAASRIPELYRYQYACAFIISPDMGGVRTPKNIWLQPAAEVAMKRAADAELRKRVCEKTIPLAQAQKEVSEDWPAVYRRYVANDVAVTVYDAPSDAPRKRILPAALASGGTNDKGTTLADVSQPGAAQTPPIEASVATGSGQSGSQMGGRGDRSRRSQNRGFSRTPMAASNYRMQNRGPRPSFRR